MARDFECRVRDGALAPDGTEALDARFFSLDELEDLPRTRISRAMLAHAKFAKPSY